jgi:Skp family chaperone for outer membrane proteins
MINRVSCLLITSLFLFTPCRAQQTQKNLFIAGVDLARVIGLHPDAQKNLVALIKERDEIRASLNAEFEKYQKIVEEGRRIEEQLQSPALSETRRRELRAQGAKIIQEAKEKGQQLQEFRQKKIQEFTLKYQAESQKILSMIRERIDKISKEKGATLVINTTGNSRANTPILQYLKPEFDLTADVLKSFGIDPNAQVPDTAVLLQAEEEIKPPTP